MSFGMMTWDVESICIWNKDAIIPVDSNLLRKKMSHPSFDEKYRNRNIDRDETGTYPAIMAQSDNAEERNLGQSYNGTLSSIMSNEQDDFDDDQNTPSYATNYEDIEPYRNILQHRKKANNYFNPQYTYKGKTYGDDGLDKNGRSREENNPYEDYD